ncbi:MAG: histone deacetylase family protein [Archaeoglobaceae archaeon]|nr:histone deacetylase family protein [Archaeoglobaceae archaeon]MCX8152563.1 histone deacetylase family protein [Archaeoglobaceae archaeon]MDW8014155.1 histone deacetylase family protein [Archaeoglobaceae archaeon]
MKIVFSPKFFAVYTSDPAASAGRLEAIVEELKEYEFVEPSMASEEEILLVHTKRHLEDVRSEGLYEISALSAGAAIRAAKISLYEPAFSLSRPPGHHASQNSSWGFCYFNNVAIAVRKLQKDGDILKAAVVDFDLHYGDGTANIFSMDKNVRYFHMPGGDVNSIANFLEKVEYDIIAVSAGFDKHVDDWGGILETEDYREIGRIIREYSEKCKGRRFAVLEGGYNHRVLGKNVKSFIKGFE